MRSECAAVEGEFRRAFGGAAAAPPRRRRATAAEAARLGGARWVWERGSVYGEPFLREFLVSHGYGHAAIAALTDAWNAGRSIPLATCDALPGAHGCQTKMVLGVPCAATLPLTPALLEEAVRRVRHALRFVGLTERFDASVCLFHARLGGAPVAAQFENARPAAAAAAGGVAAAVLTNDTWDAALYAAARERLERELREVGNRTRRIA